METSSILRNEPCGLLITEKTNQSALVHPKTPTSFLLNGEKWLHTAISTLHDWAPLIGWLVFHGYGLLMYSVSGVSPAEGKTTEIGYQGQSTSFSS